MHPDQVTRLVLTGHHLRKDLVDLHIAVPVAHVKGNLVQQVVEQRPQNAVGKSLVVTGYLIGGEPTDSRFISGSKGCLRIEVTARSADSQAPTATWERRRRQAR